MEPTAPISLIGAFLLVFNHIGVARAAGSHYSLALLGLDDVENPNIEYNLVFTSTETDAVTAKIENLHHPLETVSIPAGSIAEKTLSQPYALNGSEIINKTVLVYSDSGTFNLQLINMHEVSFFPYALIGSEIINKTVLVYSDSGTFNLQVFSKLGEHVEGFLAISRETLESGPRPTGSPRAYEYITTTFCATSGYCQFSVSAFEDDTGISVETKQTTEEVVMCNGKGYFRAHRDKHILLQKFDAVQFQSASDLTGVRIYSFKPIAVLVGSHNVTQGDTVVHMVEQLHPSSHWGTQYAVRTLGENGYGDILKISTQYPNTKIDMKGFPVFVAKHWSHNVWRRLDKGMSTFITASKPIQGFRCSKHWSHDVGRRLDKGMSTFITASKPIQVVQVTGLAYATDGETTSAGMTVVPAIENGANNYTVSCGASKDGEFHIVSNTDYGATTGVSGTLVDQADPTTEQIAYTHYEIATISSTVAADTHEPGNTAAAATISGIVKCEGTAVMPLGLQHQPLGGATATPTVNPIFCKEMVTASTTGFDPANTVGVRRHEILFGEFTVLQMRVRTCSDLTVQFLHDLGSIGHYTMFIFRHSNITVFKCDPNCDVGTQFTDDAGFMDDYDCKDDMALYWFKLVYDGGSNYICFGHGPLAPRGGTPCTTDTSVNSVAYTGQTVVRALVRATPGGADFNYDFETEEDCDYRQSSWRCEDKHTVCEEYGPTICSKEVEFAQSNCAKFCKLCKPDHYGRKFLVLKPPEFEDDRCFLYVTGYRVTPNVAVATKDKLLHVYQTEARTKVYMCDSKASTAAIVVFADADVAVSVVFRLQHPLGDQYSAVMSYPVYPVDSFGREFLLMANNRESSSADSACSIVAERSTASIMPYSTTEGGLLSGITDRISFDVGYNNVKKITRNIQPEGLFQSDSPFTVVCGSTQNAWSTTQMTPTETWGTRYVVPQLEQAGETLPFSGLALRVISNRDNTVINIDGDFNAVHTTRDRGKVVKQIITGRAAYTVTSSHPVGVGIVLEKTNYIHSFHLLPPSDRFVSKQLITVPKGILSSKLGMTSDPTSISTHLANTDGTSPDPETTTSGSMFETRYFSAEAQFGISLVQTATDEWMSMSGHQSFDHYQQSDYCETSMPVANDNKDNDCDTLTDEDTCYSGYGVYSDDFDLDGGFNDDCCCQDTNTAILGKPTEPQCLEILKPANQCWTICRCDCAWLTSLDNYNRMTEAEKTALHEAVAEQQKRLLSVDQASLSATTAAKESATDERTSATGIGLVGVGLFAAVFGTIFIMDIQSLIRDIMLTCANIREGFGRLMHCIRPGPGPA